MSSWSDIVMSKRSREESSWCTIESDPGLFTLLIEKLGVKGVQVEEIYDLEASSLAHLPPVYGFIFLFKWSKGSKEDSEKDADPELNDFSDVFFAQQEISNACATQAILHILLNSSELELGSVLENFRSFAQDLPADMRGLCLSNSLEIRQIHNEFGNLEEMLAFGDDDEEEEKDSRSKDPFHFVAFIQKNEKIYELDGLKTMPLVHDIGSSEGGKWPESVLELIKKRLEGASEIRFNLMAVVSDRRDALKAKISELTAKIDQIAGENEQKTAWLTERFKSQQDLDEEEAKWARYRKDWKERQGRIREIRAKPKMELSSQVQDLLKSMAQKGLIPKQ